MIDLNLKPSSLPAPADSSFRYYEPAAPTDGADRWHLGTAIYRLVHVAVPVDGSEPLVTLVRQTAKGRDYARSGRRTAALRYIASNIDGDVNRISAHIQQVRDALVRVALDEHRSVSATEVAREDVDYRAGDRTLFPADPSTEHMLPSLGGDLDLRVVARVGDVQLTREWQRVLDQRSGLWVEVRAVACGGDCECAGEVRLTEQPQPAPAPSWGGPAATITVDENVPMLGEGEPYVDPETGWSEPAGEEHQPLDDEDEEGTPTHWQDCANGDGRRTMHASGLCSKCRQLDATMREQMVQWPDDTLALLTVGELREVLRKAHDHGADDEEEPCSVFLDRLVRELPIPPEERAERGLPNVGRPESFERPGSAYAGALGHDPAVLGDPLPVADYDPRIHEVAFLTYLGWQRRAGHVVAPHAHRLVRLATRHPEPDACEGDEYGTWLALGSLLAEYLALDEGPITAADIRVLAAHHNVSPFAVLDLLDKRGIAHEPNPVLVPEGSEAEL